MQKSYAHIDSVRMFKSDRTWLKDITALLERELNCSLSQQEVVHFLLMMAHPDLTFVGVEFEKGYIKLAASARDTLRAEISNAYWLSKDEAEKELRKKQTL